MTLGMNVSAGTRMDELEAHVRQSIADIITTPVGTRVMRREYGSLVPDLIDQPLNRTTVLRLYAATAAAIMRWEPRVKISRIWMGYTGPGQAVVEVTCRLLTQELNISVPVGATE